MLGAKKDCHGLGLAGNGAPQGYSLIPSALYILIYSDIQWYQYSIEYPIG